MILDVILALLASAAQPPSAEQYYAQAIQAMRAVPQPEYATYDVHVHTTGLGFNLSRDAHGKAMIDMPLSRGSDAAFSAAYRKSDELTAVKTPQGWGIIGFPLFDPMWKGVNEWIRYGPLNERPGSSTLPSPSPDASAPPVIASVRTMGVAFYSVSDSGAATCANGHSAHRVHLIARKDPLNHPLTDAVIDEQTHHFCFLRFEIRQSIVAAGFDSSFELNIADVDGESVVRSGKVDLIARAVGIGVKSAHVVFAYDHFAFPKAIANDVFPSH